MLPNSSDRKFFSFFFYSSYSPSVSPSYTPLISPSFNLRPILVSFDIFLSFVFPFYHLLVFFLFITLCPHYSPSYTAFSPNPFHTSSLLPFPMFLYVLFLHILLALLYMLLLSYLFTFPSLTSNILPRTTALSGLKGATDNINIDPFTDKLSS